MYRRPPEYGQEWRRYLADLVGLGPLGCGEVQRVVLTADSMSRTELLKRLPSSYQNLGTGVCRGEVRGQQLLDLAYSSGKDQARLVSAVFPSSFIPRLNSLMINSEDRRSIAINYMKADNLGDDEAAAWVSQPPERRAGHEFVVVVPDSSVHDAAAKSHAYVDIPHFCAHLLAFGEVRRPNDVAL